MHQWLRQLEPKLCHPVGELVHGIDPLIIPFKFLKDQGVAFFAFGAELTQLEESIGHFSVILHKH
jgi:hypothetical protein